MRRLLIAFLLAGCATAPAGLKRYSYPDGNPHFEYEVRDGVPDGTGRVWYENGELRSEGTYVNGFKHGRFRFYSENGAFERQVMYWKDAEVWSSTDPHAEPSPELVTGLSAYAGTEIRKTLSETDQTPRKFELSTEPVPAPYFATLDSQTTLSRVGIEIGAGSLSRIALFGNYTLGRYAVYGRMTQANLSLSPEMNLSGRRTIEGGGSRAFELASIGTMVVHAGVLAPIGNDDQDGYIASSAAAFLRPADAAASFPSTGALRTGATLVRRMRYVVLQADTGGDAIIGGRDHPVDGLLRADVGAGVGFRAALVGVELTNALLLSDPSRSMSAAAVSGTIWFAGTWLTASAIHAFEGTYTNAVAFAVGYEL